MADTLRLDDMQDLTAPEKHTNGWWGIWAMIVTEASLFGYLLFSYFYLALQTEQHWPPEGLPKLLLPTLNTCVLLSSSLFVELANRSIRKNRIQHGMSMIATAILLGAAFVMIQLKEWSNKSYGISSDLYGSLYFTITGFHMLHVVIGLIVLLLLLVWMALGYLNKNHSTPLGIGGLYWHFVDVVWLFIFTSLYLVPYMRR